MKNRPSQAPLGLSATTTAVALDDCAIAAASGGASGLAGCFSSLAGNLATTGFTAFDAASKGRIALAGTRGITADAGVVTGETAGNTVAVEMLAAATATGPGGLDAAADAGTSGAVTCITIPGD